MDTATARPWEAEHEISAELARELIADTFDEVEGRDIELLGVGWDNTAFLVDSKWVFRFPRRKIAVDALRVETVVLPAILHLMPLDVPDPVHVAEGREGPYPWPFVGYERISGTPASDAAIGRGARSAGAYFVARFLRALHDANLEGYLRSIIPGDTIGRLDLEKRRPRVERDLDHAAVVGLVEDPAPYRAIIDELPEGWRPREDTLVHGDLYARHILVDPEKFACGVIDWGDVHLGDPAVDLAIAHSFIPPCGREIFERTYGEIDDETWRVARFRALHTTLSVLLYATEVGDRMLVREGRIALRYLRDPRRLRRPI